MSVYDSVERYAKELNMSLEKAKIRVEHFLKIKEDMHATKKCPKCHQYTLELEYGEWESGVSDWIYCSNEEYCDFTDEEKNKYLFAFEADFDVLLMMSYSVDINNEKEVLDYIGSPWSQFVDKDTKSLLEEESFII